MNEYDKQAADFLKKTGTTFSIERADPQTAPDWAKGEKHGIQYRATLANARGSYTLDFWDSIHNAEKFHALETLRDAVFGPLTAEVYRAQDLLKEEFGKKIGAMTARRDFDKLADQLKPSAYSVLACLDQLYADTFEEFCDEFGYDTDSRTAERTYSAMQEQDRRLRRLFTTEELEALQEIN